MSFGRSPLVALAFVLVGSCFDASAQGLSNASLTGKYFVRHVQFTVDGTNTVTDARSITGSVTFNGSGQYSLVGQQVVGTGSAAGFTASGTYSVSPAGVVTCTNPQKAALSINARYGAEAIAGSSTEATDGTYDLFVAVPAPQSLSNPSLNASFYAADFELTGAATAQVRNSMVTLTADGAGNFSAVSANGHAANVNSGAVSTQSIVGAMYTLNGDGTGTAVFPLPAGFSASTALLGAAQRTIQLSSSGNVLLGATPGAHDILIAVKAFSGSATNASIVPSNWFAGLRVDAGGASAAYVGSRRAGASMMVGSRRLHQSGSGPVNETDANAFTIASDGSGSVGASKLGLGTGGGVLATANVSRLSDPTGYEIGFSMAMPSLSGPGVFIHPLGVVNAASLAPALDAISPGEFIAIYGSGLATATAVAAPPYPMSVGTVSVTIGGLPAPIYFASTGQINCLVPFGLTGTTANVVVKSNGVVSNTVSVPVANTSPGVFTLDGSGTNDGAILHADYSIVNAASPAKKGETVSMYMTGLGALTAPVADGFGATAVDFAKTPLQVLVNGTAAQVSYSGLSVLPGLYQINFQIPPMLQFSGEIPIAILTPEAFHDQVSVFVQ